MTRGVFRGVNGSMCSAPDLLDKNSRKLDKKWIIGKKKFISQMLGLFVALGGGGKIIIIVINSVAFNQVLSSSKKTIKF